MKPPVFICGYPRSGTTLLSTLLDGHPELIVFPEETLFRRVSMRQFESREKCVDYLFSETPVKHLDSSRQTKAAEMIGGLGIIEYDGFDFLFLRECVSTKFLGSRGTLPELFECLMGCYAELTGQNLGRYYVEKTPSNEFRLHQFFKWWPEAKAIYITRDPRAAFLSHATKVEKQSEGKVNLSVERFVLAWGNSLSAWCRQASNRDCCMLVRYEDLVQHRELVMRKLSDFLKIDFHPLLLSPTKMGKPWLGISSSGRVMDGSKTALGEQWEAELSDSQVKVIEAYLGKAMVLLGYVLMSPLITFRDFVLVWAGHKMKWQLLKMLVRSSF